MDNRGGTALHAACLKNHAECLQMLLADERGCNAINTPNASGLTPLAIVCHLRHAESLRLLLVHGADLNAGAWDMTPLMIAAREGFTEGVRELSSRGAWTDHRVSVSSPTAVACSWTTMTALMHACSAGHVECVEILLSSGASAGMEDSDGKTAADFCSDHSADAIKRLLSIHSVPYVLK
jgi:serine/threonine-protein phosphatase 6 regulatory ankyrin repeat subunit C